MGVGRLLRQVTTDFEWAIGAVDLPVAEFLQHIVDHGEAPDLAPSWLKPSGGYSLFADPAGITWHGRKVVLFEAYHPWEGRGVIEGCVHDESGFGSLTTVLDEREVHFAFPTTVEVDDVVLCIPDSSDLRGTRVYRGADPLRLEPIGHLDGVPALRDPVVWQDDDGRWVLLGLDISHRAQVLRVFRAHHPLEHWSEVGAGIANAGITGRPAGPVVRLADGRLVRPAQDCRDEYGSGIVVRELRFVGDELTEKVLGVAGPRSEWPFDQGFHTVVGVGGTTFIDGRRLALTALAGPRRVSRRVIGLSSSPAPVE